MICLRLPWEKAKVGFGVMLVAAGSGRAVVGKVMVGGHAARSVGLVVLEGQLS